jgi:hypothetical protein
MGGKGGGVRKRDENRRVRVSLYLCSLKSWLVRKGRSLHRVQAGHTLTCRCLDSDLAVANLGRPSERYVRTILYRTEAPGVWDASSELPRGLIFTVANDLRSPATRCAVSRRA